MSGFHFARPWALLLLAALPLAALLLWRARRHAARLRFPGAPALRARPGPLARLAPLPPALLLLALALVAVALARPRAAGSHPREVSVEGIDIVIAFDLSTSMRAVDFRPENRLHVAKQVLKEFIARRPNDRIGLVVFAGEAYTQCPLTLDHGILSRLVDQLRFGVIEDGTAIGNALATALNRLRESEAKSRVVILLTDGDNNAGQISPLEAARIARELKVPIFPILVGRGGVVPYPVDADVFGQPVYREVEIPVNPELLQEIARVSGGQYVNATDQASLARGLDAVLDKLERSRLADLSAPPAWEELAPAFLQPAFWLGAAALLLGATRLRPFP
ncbi:MAG TPA: VWA domain-containing protein [Anaeromyxobacteraceae bacterium]|jgi:Ca-activated chloride channel family protein|nr:VWA domain-containing protein [Anaeromyxobacteraceae bacterium]